MVKQRAKHRKKAGISRVKRCNQIRTKLIKQGKLKPGGKNKYKKPESKPVQVVKPVEAERTPEEIDEDGRKESEDLLGMVEEEDLEFLRQTAEDKGFSFLKGAVIDEVSDSAKSRKGRKRLRGTLEERYEKQIAEEMEENSRKKVKHLLPIKTAQGLVVRTMEEEVDEDDGKEEDVNALEESANDGVDTSNQNGATFNETVSIPELYARRDTLLRERKLQIGILASGVVEDPENKGTKNLSILLPLLDERDSLIKITTQKLVLVSLLEIFKDIIPSYSIKHQEDQPTRLKKDTIKLQMFEKRLLKWYKLYLKKLELFLAAIVRKKGDTRTFTEPEKQVAILSLRCLCELLVTNPHFNFAQNIAQLLVPVLDLKDPEARKLVYTSLKKVFREDKRGEISLEIVRKINHLVKTRKRDVHKEILDVLLFLRIKDVNLDKEKEDEIKKKKFMTHREKLIRLSRMERKKSKKLQELEKELLEAKAEEGKQTKIRFLTEITKLVFTIYFRILKRSPGSQLMGSVLEGLAKFAHCINLDFFQDLIVVLHELVEGDSLGYRERLHCIQTVFTILSGQGEALNIDPLRFYTHLYNNLFHLHAGRSHADVPIALHSLHNMLIRRHKRVSHQRMLAFTKRLATLSLQLLHNGTIGSLSLVRTILMVHKTADILLDSEEGGGGGTFLAELPEPEHCNANATILWELQLLQRHYHPMVRKMAKNVALSAPMQGEGVLPVELTRKSAEELFQEYNGSQMAFKPPVLPPNRKEQKKKTVKLRDLEFASSLRHTLELDDSVRINYYKRIVNRRQKGK